MSEPNIDVRHLARLARLELNPDDEAEVRASLSRIIDMIDDMQSVDTTGVEPMSHPLDMTQRLRPDAVTETVDRARLQEGAPATEDGYYLVPRVVE